MTPIMLNPLTTGIITFAVILTGAFGGWAITQCLPAHHLSDETKSLVSVSMAVVATVSALVLGSLRSKSSDIFFVGFIATNRRWRTCTRARAPRSAFNRVIDQRARGTRRQIERPLFSSLMGEAGTKEMELSRRQIGLPLAITDKTQGLVVGG